MNIALDELLEKLRACSAHICRDKAGAPIEIRLRIQEVQRAAEIVRDAGLYPVFMTAVHVQEHFLLVYQFATAEQNQRITLSASVEENEQPVSLTPVFPGLQWHEREVRDMFGITFEAHPDMRPLLLPDEDRDLHPLRKDEQRIKTLEQISAGPGSGEAP